MASQIQRDQAPAFVAAIPTPTLGDGGSASVVFSTTINAPPARCLGIMLDPATYPTWNRWIPRAVVTASAASSAATTAAASSSSIPPSLAHMASSSQQDLQLLPGTKFYFEVHMNPDSASFRKTELEITVLEEFERDGRKGLRVAWKTQGDPWHLRAERVQEFLDNGEGGSEYTNFETFYGPLTWVVRFFVGKQLEAGLRLWMDGLKAAAEGSD